MLERIKEKWGITSSLQMVVIFIVFGVTGSASTLVSGPALDFLNIQKEAFYPIIYWPLRILIVFPIYQVLLVCFGFIFGRFVLNELKKDKFIFNFFCKMASKMSKAMLRVLSVGILFKK